MWEMSAVARLNFLFFFAFQNFQLSRGSEPKPILFVPPLVPRTANNLSILIPPTMNFHVGHNVSVHLRLTTIRAVFDGTVMDVTVTVGIPRMISLIPPSFHPSYILRINSSAIKYEEVLYPKGDPGVRVVIDTNKIVFRPGDTIKVRILALEKYDRELSVGSFRISLKDPSGMVTRIISAKWDGKREFLRKTFGLPVDAPPGRWAITVATENTTANDSFPAVTEILISVRAYTLPKFSVELSASKTFLLSNVSQQLLTIFVEARFAHGSRKRLTEMIIETHCLGKKTKTKTTGNQRHNETLSIIVDGNDLIVVDVLVRDFQSGELVASALQIPVVVSPYQLQLRPLKSYLGPSYVFQVKALLVDGTSRPNVSLVVSTTLMKRPSVSPSDKGYGILRKDLPDKSFVTGIDGKVLVELKEIPSYMEVAVIKVATVDSSLMSSQQMNITVVVPSAVPSSSFVSVTLDRHVYKIGDILEAIVVHSSDLGRLFYAIRCGAHILVHSVLPGNSSVKYKVDHYVGPACDLLVYSVIDGQDFCFDLAEFEIIQICQGNISADKAVYHPGELVTLLIFNSPNGITTLKATDSRLRSTNMSENEIQTSSVTAETLADPNRLSELCTAAGSLYLRLFKTVSCLEPTAVHHSIVDSCGSRMTQGCAQVQILAAAPAAGSAEPGGFGRQIFLGGSISSDENEVRHSTAAQISASDRNKATEPDLRTQFHDSWLFEDVFSESTIAVALRAKMPQSLSAWAITPTFWSPLEGICSGAPLTISSDKKVFLDVDMPDWVLVNEQIQLKVFIHSYHDTGPKEFDLCQEFPPQVCVSYGSSDQTSKPVKSVVVGSNGFATVSFFMEFLETGSFNVRFFLLDQKAVVTESNSCADRGAVVDAIEKKIRVESRDRTQTLNVVGIVSMETPSPALNISNEVLSLVPLRNVISGESAYQLKMSLPESFRPIRLQLSLSDDLVSVNEIDAVREVIETYYHEATANHKSLLIGEKVLTDLLQKIILFRLAAIHMSNPTENGNAPVKKLSQLHLLTDAVETGFVQTQKFMDEDGSYRTYLVGGQQTLWLTILTTDQLCRVGWQNVCSSLEWIMRQQEAEGSFYFAADTAQFSLWSDETEYRQCVTAIAVMTLESCKSITAGCPSLSTRFSDRQSKAIEYLWSQKSKKMLSLLPLSLTTFVMATIDASRAVELNEELLRNRVITDSYIVWNYEAQSSLSFWQKSWQKLKSVFNSKKSDQSKLTKQFALNGLALWSQLSLGNPQKDLPLIKSFQWLVTSWRQTDQQLLDTWACLGAMVSYTQSHLISSNVSVMAECVDRCDRLDSSAIPSFHSITNGTKHIDLSPSSSSYKLTFRGSGQARVTVTLQYEISIRDQNPSGFVNLNASLPLSDEEWANLTICMTFDSTKASDINRPFQLKLVVECLTGFTPELERTWIAEGNGQILDSFGTTTRSFELYFIDRSPNISFCLIIPFASTGVAANQPLASIDLYDETVGLIARTTYSDGNFIPLVQKFCDSDNSNCHCSPSVCADSCSSDYNMSVLADRMCAGPDIFAWLVSIIASQSYSAKGVVVLNVRVETVFTARPTGLTEDHKEFVFVQRFSCSCPIYERKFFYLFVGNGTKFFSHHPTGKLGYILGQDDILQKWTGEQLNMRPASDGEEQQWNQRRMWLYKWKEEILNSVDPCTHRKGREAVRAIHDRRS